jgi:Ca-activated chloride channel family protein
MSRSNWTKTAAAAAMMMLVACSADSGSSEAADSWGGAGTDGGANTGNPDSGEPQDDGFGPAVGQGGAQDFGQFRKILEEGGIPGPETIDDVGFFAEHRIPLGQAGCEDSVCIHGELGVMGNFIDGSNCTMVMVGLTTPLDIETLPRPPLNLSIAIDVSGSMQGPPIEYVREGLRRMVAELEPGDRVSVVVFSDEARILVEFADPDDPALADAIESVSAGGSTNVYAGLRGALELARTHVDPERQNRALLLSDGESNVGVVSDGHILDLAESYAKAGFGLSTIGVGEQFDPELMRGLSERGNGVFYFAEDPSAVQEIFVEEARAWMVPIAQDVSIELQANSSYEVRDVFGTALGTTLPQRASMEIPMLQIAHRESAGDNEQGRRGGGGAIVVELMPTGVGVMSPGEVGSLSLRYRVPHTEEWVESTVSVDSPLAPGQTPPQGHFEADGAAKAFVTLNLYAGFETASRRASVGDDAAALGVLLPLRDAVDAWETENPDADIADDLVYVDLFIDNLRARGAEDPAPDAPRPDPWPKD